MLDGQRQFTGRQWPVEHLHRAIGTADQPCAQPQMWLQRQVGMIDQQQRRRMQLAVVMVDACAEFAAQPGKEKRPFHLCAELALPALFELGQQRHQQLLAQRPWRIQGDGLIDAVIQRALIERGDRRQQRLMQTLPIVFHGFREGLRRIEQWLDLADRNATVEPGEDGHDSLHMFSAIQSMALGRALGHHQAVATFPRAQGDGVDAGLPRDFANRQPALVEGFLEVGAEVFPGAAVGFIVH